MYFNKKEDTNIDSEFNNGNKFKLNFNFDSKKLKPFLFIGGALLILIIIIVIVVMIISSGSNKNQYTIQLLGDTEMSIKLGENYIEPGYKAYDTKQNDLTEQVEVQNEVDSSTIGSYKVTYTLDDIKRIRYVNVIEISQKTYIYLKGSANMYLEVGEKYVEPGYQVYDNVEQNLNEKVKITGSVNTSKVGTYQITYSVVNSSNVTTSVKRTIIVIEKGQKP